MLLDDLLTDRQPDPGPAILVPRMQALEDVKDPGGLLGIEADSIILDREDPVEALAPSSTVHTRRR
jgi:hypothetical protein